MEQRLIDANGKYITNDNYKEIHALDKMLCEAKVPHTITSFYDGWQICYPTDIVGKRVMDAIEHFGSYGKEKDLLEIMGLLTVEEEQQDSVLGYLSAAEVFERIKRHWDGVEK